MSKERPTICGKSRVPCCAEVKFSRNKCCILLTQFSFSLQPYYFTILTLFCNNQATFSQVFNNMVTEIASLKIF